MLFCCGCAAPSQEETAISNHVQTVGNTKTDLSFEMQELNFVKDVKATDSLNILTKLYNGAGKQNTVAEMHHHLNSSFKVFKDLQKTYRFKVDSLDAVKNPTGLVYDLKVIYLEALIKMSKEFPFDSVQLTQFNKYYADPTRLLCKEYRAKYSIKNPLLNGVKQELDRTAYLSPQGDKVYVIK
jgi:hypothetical protein